MYNIQPACVVTEQARQDSYLPGTPGRLRQSIQTHYTFQFRSKTNAFSVIIKASKHARTHARGSPEVWKTNGTLGQTCATCKHFDAHVYFVAPDEHAHQNYVAINIRCSEELQTFERAEIGFLAWSDETDQSQSPKIIVSWWNIEHQNGRYLTCAHEIWTGTGRWTYTTLDLDRRCMFVFYGLFKCKIRPTLFTPIPLAVLPRYTQILVWRIFHRDSPYRSNALLYCCRINSLAV